MESLLDLARALEASPFGAWMRGSDWAYPVANLIHLLGLVMLLGAIGILDLRIAGAFRELPLAASAAALTPLAVAGLGLAVFSGAGLFAADAGALFVSATFRWKVALIGAALLNILLFRLVLGRDLGQGAEPSLAARISALASIGLWLWIAALGRLIAYA